LSTEIRPIQSRGLEAPIKPLEGTARQHSTPPVIFESSIDSSSSHDSIRSFCCLTTCMRYVQRQLTRFFNWLCCCFSSKSQISIKPEETELTRLPDSSGNQVSDTQVEQIEQAITKKIMQSISREELMNHKKSTENDQEGMTCFLNLINSLEVLETLDSSIENRYACIPPFTNDQEAMICLFDLLKTYVIQLNIISCTMGCADIQKGFVQELGQMAKSSSEEGIILPPATSLALKIGEKLSVWIKIAGKHFATPLPKKSSDSEVALIVTQFVKEAVMHTSLPSCCDFVFDLLSKNEPVNEQMLTFINQQRAKQALPPISLDRSKIKVELD
jgi:hypothetical protein